MVKSKKEQMSSKQNKKRQMSKIMFKTGERKTSFKKRKGKLRYSNSNKSQHKDFQQECERLEKLVLGDGSGLLNSLDSVEKILECQLLAASPDSGFDPSDVVDIESSERKPAWEDPDDDQKTVSEALEAQGRLRKGLPGNSAEEYKTVLKRKFEMRVGNPEWAKLKKKRPDSESDEDDGALLKRCGNFIEKKTSVLNKGVLDFKKLTNLNKQTQNEGPFINTVEFHPTSTVALVAGSSGRSTIFQVDGTNNPSLQTVKFDRFPIRCAKFSHDGNSFLVGSHRHSHFFMYDMIEGRTVRLPTHHATEQTNMKKFEVSPDGRLIAILGRFGHIHLLNARTKEWIDSLKMNDEVADICFNSDGSRLYSHGEGGEVYVWDTYSRSCCHRFTDEGCILGTSIAVSPNSQLLACGSSSGVVNIYQTSTVMQSKLPQPIKTVLNLVTPISLLNFNPTSELLAMTSSEKDNAIKLLHFPSLTVFKNFPTSRTSLLGQVHSQAFSPSSGYLAYGNSSSTAFLFRLKHFGNY